VPGWGLAYSIRTTSGDRSVAYYHTDRRGSTLAVTDPAGEVTHRFAYTPYGRLLADASNSSPSCPPFLFLGHYGCHTLPGTDALYRHGARAYMPETGRFVSPEPEWPDIANPNRLNIYNYAYSDPINFIDYSGFDGTWDLMNPEERKIKNEIENIEFEIYLTGKISFNDLLEPSNAFNRGIWNNVFGSDLAKEVGLHRLGLDEQGLITLDNFAQRVIAHPEQFYPQSFDPQDDEYNYDYDTINSLSITEEAKKLRKAIAKARIELKNRRPEFLRKKIRLIMKKNKLLIIRNPALQTQNSCGGTQVPVFKR